jgi:hypothetical protein
VRFWAFLGKGTSKTFSKETDKRFDVIFFSTSFVLSHFSGVGCFSDGSSNSKPLFHLDRNRPHSFNQPVRQQQKQQITLINIRPRRVCISG